MLLGFSTPPTSIRQLSRCATISALGIGKLLRTKKWESGVIGPNPKLDRRVSNAQGISLWRRKLSSIFDNGMARRVAALKAKLLSGEASRLSPANDLRKNRRSFLGDFIKDSSLSPTTVAQTGKRLYI